MWTRPEVVEHLVAGESVARRRRDLREVGRSRDARPRRPAPGAEGPEAFRDDGVSVRIDDAVGAAEVIEREEARFRGGAVAVTKVHRRPAGRQYIMTPRRLPCARHLFEQAARIGRRFRRGPVARGLPPPLTVGSIGEVAAAAAARPRSRAAGCRRSTRWPCPCASSCFRWRRRRTCARPRRRPRACAQRDRRSRPPSRLQTSDLRRMLPIGS